MLRGIEYVTDGRFISSEVDNFAIDVHSESCWKIHQFWQHPGKIIVNYSFVFFSIVIFSVRLHVFP